LGFSDRPVWVIPSVVVGGLTALGGIDSAELRVFDGGVRPHPIAIDAGTERALCQRGHPSLTSAMRGASEPNRVQQTRNTRHACFIAARVGTQDLLKSAELRFIVSHGIAKRA
jgi:hypothetical protein